MICCGTGFDFGKVFVPIPVPIPVQFRFRFRTQTIFSTVFKKRKFHKVLPFQCQKQLISQKVGLSFLIFFLLFIIAFTLDPVRTRSSLMVRASDCQCTSCNGPGFDPSFRRHSGIWGVAEEAVLDIVWKKDIKKSPKIFLKKSYGSCGSGSGATTLADSYFRFEQLANRHRVHCEKNKFCRLFKKKIKKIHKICFSFTFWI